MSGMRPYVLCVEYEEIFVFEDLILAPNVACLRCLVDDCLRNLEQDRVLVRTSFFHLL